MTFTHFYCAGPVPTGGAALTFKVDVTTFSGGTATTSVASLTCVVASGESVGTTFGSVTVNAGQAIDVSITGGSSSVPTTAGGASWGLAP
jgi:hypothetical protein